MPGASKKRGKLDRQAQRGAGQGPAPAAAPPAEPTPPPTDPVAYDGPGDNRGGPSSRPPGNRGGRPPTGAPRQSGPPASQTGPSDSPAPESSRPRVDPAREQSMILNKNVDFPGNAYNLISQMPTTLMPRPAKFNSSGKPATISVNSHRIISYPKNTIYQYDINIGNGAEKRGLIKGVWESKSVKDVIGQGFIFDGNKIGWSMTNFKDEIRLQIDLDKERGIPPREGRAPNVHRVNIRKAKIVNLSVLEAYLAGQMDFDNSVLEAINFLDHLLRETPSKNLIAVRRSYFGRTTQEREMIGRAVEAMKGVYQSIRAAQGRQLVINVDVSNTCFWHQQVITVLAYQLAECTGMDQVGVAIQPIQVRGGGTRESPAFTALKRLHKNEFRVNWRGIPDSIARKTFKILRVSEKNSRQYKFDLKDRATGETIPDVSVEEYFKRKYNLTLQWPEFPVLETTKKGVVYPMECSIMLGGQRYPYKLNELQTSNMIKFAVSRPAERKASISRGLDLLKWDSDPFLSNYGLKIDRNMLKTEARVLNPPVVLFGKKATVAPGFSGRWDLRGKQFLHGNKAPIKSWGVAVIKGIRPTPLEAVQAFIRDFIKIYRSHGGEVHNTTPIIHENVTDGGKAVENLFLAVGNACQYRPQIMFFVLPTKNAEMYTRLKKSADCRYGVVSQCVNVNHLMKNQPQYHSNLAMKVNAKLGGTTCRVNLGATGHFKVPTMIIGADVSHAAPGSQAASFAAFTVSMDAAAVRYAAAVETNGHRVEMIATRNIEDMLRPLLLEWCMNTGQGMLPKHVYYFRDGVSEGQYQNVLKQEVADIKRLMNSIGQHDPNLNIKFTVVVAEKRHHIRFFPQGPPASDKNGNPVPGTLVEKDVTHPFEYDFYLCSHSAIQGTARPTHYHMLMDECGVAGDEFQKMLYEHSYQYMRATTPVSLHPAVYYAHLASNRARSHVDISQTQLEFEKSGGSSSEKPDTEAKPLIPMPNKTGIRWTMWYI